MENKYPHLKPPEKVAANKNKYKFGTVAYLKEWTCAILILGVVAVAFFGVKHSEVILAKQNEVIEHRHLYVICSDDYKPELIKFAGCVPRQCGRAISDMLVTANEAEILLHTAKKGISLGGLQGSVSILDLHSGALSLGRNFINIYHQNAAKNVFQKTDFSTYKVVKTKIKNAVADYFGVQHEKLYLTHPTFFSCLTAAPSLTMHDEYWHPHVDKETYESFHYTSLLYLSDYDTDFQGGRFIFVDKDNINRTIEPRKGRVSMFTSGSENLHFVERVMSGMRYALTVSFTCNPKYAIDDSTILLKQDQP